jgi:hypothetical protein
LSLPNFFSPDGERGNFKNYFVKPYLIVYLSKYYDRISICLGNSKNQGRLNLVSMSCFSCFFQPLYLYTSIPPTNKGTSFMVSSLSGILNDAVP